MNLHAPLVAGLANVADAVPEPLRYTTALAWGGAVALAMSTQLLFQPFVWRHFSADQVLAGWFSLALERLAVTLPIALSIALASRSGVRASMARAAVLGLGLLTGALLGELLLIGAGSIAAPTDAASVAIRLSHWVLQSASIALLFYLWRRSGTARAAAQATELHRVRAHRQLVQLRLQTLRSQIEPHFLFNTLATVRRLHHTEHRQGAQLLTRFLEYLRLTQPERQAGHNTLGQEIALVQAYLSVVSVRMAGRLSLNFDVAPALHGCEFPALTVATLVENAVKHGIGPAPQGGCISVSARCLGDSLEVVVADTGVGFSASGGSGIGLANIRARLHTLYGIAGTLTLAGNLPRGVCATLRVPCQNHRVRAASGIGA